MLVSEGLELARPRSSRRQPQPQQSDPLKCPRCESTNTKFCYYNNYNKTQPRYYCKACKRHWTEGGTLRNVPVGGGRKHRRFNLPNITATAATTNMGSMVIRNKHSIDQRGLLGLSDPQDTSDAAKALFFKPTGSERRDDVESYTDIEELKGLASWDIYGSFTGCTMQQLPHEDHQRLGFSKLSSSFETNHGSNTPRSCIDKLENVEGSTTTTTSMMIMPSSQQWQVASTSNILEPNYRSWNDLDTMVLEDLNKPWEDPQFQT